MTRAPDSPVRISIIGAALSANKGAAAMVETVVARAPEVVGNCQFSLLTTHPDRDRSKIEAHSAVEVVGLEPLRLALVEFPVALLAWVLRMCRLPTRWVRTRAGRRILQSDVVVDVAGISFADGRGIPITVYNAMMTGLPLLLGIPTIKLAQAMGPFATQPNRLLARWILPQLAAVCARGARTRAHVDELGLTNVVDVADLAFGLQENTSVPSAVDGALAAMSSRPVVVMPSAVVRRLVRDSGLAVTKEIAGADVYVSAMVDLISRLRVATGRSVVIAPHSYLAGASEGRMNDGPVCREIAEHLRADAGVVLIDEDLTAAQLRGVIARAEVLVTSRFHAMISGLATCTPTVVVGWSHKYREVLDDFEMTEMGLDSSALSHPEDIVDKVVGVIGQREQLSRRIEAALPAVQARSHLNFVTLARVLAESSRS